MTATTPIASNQRAVEILVGNHQLNGFLNIPESPTGAVIFALRSGRGRYRPRNQYLACVLHRVRIATLLLELLDEREADVQSKVFDIQFLAHRLEAATRNLREKGPILGLPLGYFGVSTGAAAALVAAADQGNEVQAIVSRCGRPDLASESLPRVEAATLLIVGGEDKPIVEVNRNAMARLRCVKELRIIPGAGHSFSEPALEEAGHLAAEWFQAHLACPSKHEFAKAKSSR